MADEKIIARIEKLLRLAAPSSNSTEPERASAALEASRLIDEHGLTFAELRTPKRNGKAPWGTWTPSVALNHAGCSWCHKAISRGDVVWIRVLRPGEVEYRHNYGQCKERLD